MTYRLLVIVVSKLDLTVDCDNCNSYLWDPTSETTQTITISPPLSGGTYSVDVTDINGCEASASYDLIVESFEVDASAFDDSYCLEECIDFNQLDLPAGTDLQDLDFVVLDQSGITVATPNPGGNNLWCFPNTFMGGNYSVVWSYTSQIGCEYSDTLDFEIEGNQDPDLNATPTACVGGEINLEVQNPNANNGTWELISCPPNQSPCSFSSSNISPTYTLGPNYEPGTYIFEYDGTCITDATIEAEVYDNPPIELINPYSTICPGDSIELSELINFTESDFSIQDVSDIDSCNWNISPQQNTSGSGCFITAQQEDEFVTYSVTVFENGCSSNASIDIETAEQPWDDISETLSYCDNEPATLDLDSYQGSVNSNFTWSLLPSGPDPIPSSQLTNFDLEPLDPGFYDFILEHELGDDCIFRDTLSAEILELEELEVFDVNTSYCVGDSVDPAFDTEFEDFDAANLTVTLIDCPIGQPCNTTISLPWDTEGYDSGTYEIEFSGECLESDTVTVQLFPIPQFDAVSEPDAPLCPGDSAELVIDIDTNIEIDDCDWSSGDPDVTIPSVEDDCSIVVSPSSTSTYNASVTSNGCSNMEPVTVAILDDPFSLNCNSLQSEYCTNDTACVSIQDLLPNTNVDQSAFTWMLDDEEIESAEICLDTISDGDHHVWYEYIDANSGCTFTDSCMFSITSDLEPVNVIGISQGDQASLNDGDTLSICMGEEVQLQSNSSLEGEWSLTSSAPAGSSCPPNFTSDEFNLQWNTDVNNDCPGIYGFQFSAVCADTAMAYVQIFPNPEVELSILPGETVCAGDSLTIEATYTGQYEVDSVVISGPGLNGGVGPSEQNGNLFIWDFDPGALYGSYDFYLEDETICPYQTNFDIEIQEVNFEISNCSAFDGQYCENSDVEIDLQDELIVGTIPPGTFSWHLVDLSGDTLEIDNIFNPSDYNAGDYVLYYDFIHGESPYCNFSDTCQFAINELSDVSISSEVGYCLSEDASITATYPDQFSGSWQVIDSPQGNCLQVSSNSGDTFEFTPNCMGNYTISFSGNCLETVEVSFEVVSIPVAEWTAEDLSPCLNECFEFEAEALENYSSYQWTYNDDPVSSPLCFEDPGSGNLCLEAVQEHSIEGQTISCVVEDCEILDPVESPGGVLDIPEQYCAGSEINIGDDWVDLNLYEDCELSFTPAPNNDCGSTFNLNSEGPYGTFPYELILGYGQGCEDTLSGEIFIPEPPSATLQVDYDSCVADVDVALPGLTGDNLDFDWSVDLMSIGDNNDWTNVSADVLSDQYSSLPVPNPIPLGDLAFTTDTAFTIGVDISNPQCSGFEFYSLQLDTSGYYIAPPDLYIDILDTSGTVFCSPVELAFEAFVSNTVFIDSVSWNMTSSLTEETIFSETFESTEPTDPILFENFDTTPDTVTIEATAYNRCGQINLEEDIHIIPDSVFVKIPDSLSGACGGQTIEFQALEQFGEIYNYSITAYPNIPGLNYSTNENYTSYTVNIPESTIPDSYELTLTLEGCGMSTDYTCFEVFPDPDVDFEVTEDGCTNEEIIFTNLTEGASSFEWDFGDGEFPNEDNYLANPSHTYGYPGTYYTTLTATSDSGCIAQTTDSVFIYGPNPSFQLEENRVCSGTPIEYDLPDNDSLIGVKWEFMLPGVDTIVSVADTNTFITLNNNTEEIQNWDLTLTLTDQFGCQASSDTSIFIYPLPIASFTYSSLEHCAIGEEVHFDNVQQSNVQYAWNFDDPESGFNNQILGSDPGHRFSSPGEYTITLMATTTTIPVCKEVVSRRLACDNINVYVPNAFTPDENGLNDIFKPEIYGIHDIHFDEENYYTFQVFDRWGQIIFDTHDPDAGWNGSVSGGNYYAKPDVYNWRVNIIFPDGSEEWTGSVMLVR